MSTPADFDPEAYLAGMQAALDVVLKVDGPTSWAVEHIQELTDTTRREQEAAAVADGELTPEELELLQSYAAGPRIWDATSLQARVARLHERGMIDPVDAQDGRYTITHFGRQWLKATK